MTISIYSPEVRALAQSEGITELQAYRRLKSREQILRMEAAGRRQLEADLEAYNRRNSFMGGILARFIDNRISPDWNKQ